MVIYMVISTFYVTWWSKLPLICIRIKKPNFVYRAISFLAHQYFAKLWYGCISFVPPCLNLCHFLGFCYDNINCRINLTTNMLCSLITQTCSTMPTPTHSFGSYRHILCHIISLVVWWEKVQEGFGQCC